MNSENVLLQMQKISKGILKAKEMEGKSVVLHRKEALDEAVITLREDPEARLTLFGVKNTSQISMELVKKLQSSKGFIFHTIDKMAERGRAIDVDLINPLTGRVMTGSSSGGCVNILRGINDLAIGTDGGGSVLAPAMSTGLYSIMGKGLGLMGRSQRISTDKISFLPGIGVISHDYNLCIHATAVLTNIEDIDSYNLEKQKLRVAVPKEGSVTLPNGKDMRIIMEEVLNKIHHIVDIVEEDFSNADDRNSLISLSQSMFNDNIDIIITAEGPIDIYGRGDSVLGLWGGTGADIQNKSGKYFLKVANMIDATAVTIPTGELGIGILITARKGANHGKAAIKLGSIISEIFHTPELFKRYFIDGYKQESFGLLK